MKKIIFVFLVVMIIFFVGNNPKIEHTNNLAENEKVQETNQAQNKISETEPSVREKSLDGKTIAFLGDSLIRGYGNEDRGFDYYLAQELPNTNFLNNSKSGSTITDNSGTDNIIMLNQAKTLTGNPDIIVLDGGANDIMGYALGFLNNDLKKEIGKAESSSEESVISDLEEVIVELKNRFPDAKLCYVQPFLLDEDTINHLTNDEMAKQEIQSRRDQFFTEVQKMCSKWQITYLDVSNQFAGTGMTYRQDDWIHIKEAGYQLITPAILNGLKEM